MLHITNLSVSIDTDSSQLKQILKNCSLQVDAGQLHVLMGPNGSGKSSLVYTIMGHPAYQVDAGVISFNQKDLLSMSTHLRSQNGIYLSMQQPQSIPGLRVLAFLREIYTKRYGQISINEFMETVRPLLQQVGLDESMLYRSVNEGFSGGEKKRFELMQMLLLKPQLCLLDEIDSGVDIDGLKIIAQCLQNYKKQNPQVAIIIVTHYRRILDYLTPDVVHVMVNGTIVSTGDVRLINQIENQGYEQYANGIK